MKYNSKKIIAFIIITFLSIVMLGCTNNNSFIKDIDLIMNKSSEINYTDYIDFTMDPIEQKAVYSTDKQVNPDASHLVYRIVLTNKTNKDIKIKGIFYTPKELDQIVMSNTMMDITNNETIIKPQRDLIYSEAIIIKNPEKLSNEDRIIFDKHKNTIFYELSINGKKAYGQINAK